MPGGVSLFGVRFGVVVFENFIAGVRVFLLLRQASIGTRWMPWHQEPMKDVRACDKPWGVGNEALIQGCPNGETWRGSCPVVPV